MNRRVTVLMVGLLAVCLASAPCAALAAALTFPDVDPELTEVVGLISSLGIMVGYDDGQFHPDRPFIREHLATVVVRLRGLEPEAKALTGVTASMYADARPADWWSNGYLIVAYNRGLMIGDAPDGQGRRMFRPGDNASLDEVLTITIRVLLGDKLAGPWPAVYRDRAVEMGLLQIMAARTGKNQAELLAQVGSQRASRGEIAEVLYTALTATAEGQALARTLRGEQPVATGDEVAVTATVSPALFGCMVKVTSSFAGAHKFRVYDGELPVTAVSALGSNTTMYPAKKAGEQVTVRLYAQDGVTLLAEKLITLAD